MPELRGMTVHVTTDGGQPLEEYGVQTFRRANKVSCYIKSETNMSFRVSITPKIPFKSQDTPAAHYWSTRKRGQNKPGFFDMQDEWEDLDDPGHRRIKREEPDDQGINGGFRRGSEIGTKPRVDHYSPSRRHSDSLDETNNPGPKNDPDIKREEDEDTPMGLWSSKHTRGDVNDIPPPPFHFLATLYLDGRSIPERKVVVYLDPDDEDFHSPDGTVSFKNRWVEGKDGRLFQQSWLFQDVGIESIFDRLLISGEANTANTVYKREEEDIISAMNATGLGEEGSFKKDEKIQAGQIKVTLERVLLGDKWHDTSYRPKLKEGADEDVNMDGSTKDVTHTTGFHKRIPMGQKPIRVVGYTPYDPLEGLYATFHFFYRSEEKLQRYNFENFSATTGPKPRLSRGRPRDKRQLNKMLLNMTPLSIKRLLTSGNVDTKTSALSSEGKLMQGCYKQQKAAKLKTQGNYRSNDERVQESEERDLTEADGNGKSSSPETRLSESGDSSSPGEAKDLEDNRPAQTRYNLRKKVTCGQLGPYIVKRSLRGMEKKSKAKNATEGAGLSVDDHYASRKSLEAVGLWPPSNTNPADGAGHDTVTEKKTIDNVSVELSTQQGSPESELYMIRHKDDEENDSDIEAQTGEAYLSPGDLADDEEEQGTFTYSQGDDEGLGARLANMSILGKRARTEDQTGEVTDEVADGVALDDSEDARGSNWSRSVNGVNNLSPDKYKKLKAKEDNGGAEDLAG